MINTIWAVYFSPTGSTKQLTVHIAEAAAKTAEVAWEALCAVSARNAVTELNPASELNPVRVRELDFTKPENRQKPVSFGPEDFVIFGMPTYAGRMPNKIMPYLRDMVKGGGASAVCAVTYGGRSFDDSLAELSDLLEEAGFVLRGGGAFVCRHAFAEVAVQRPEKADFEKAVELGKGAMKSLQNGRTLNAEVFPGNHPAGPYYVPKGTDGKPAVFLKARPVTDTVKCTGCGLCAVRCPMGSIQPKEPFETIGICIKCQACIAACPQGAKYFADEAFLSHKAMLERDFAGSRGESRIWL